jgi:hypothetical protein
LAVYVDDFKLAGVEKDIAPAWKAISEAVSAEPPTEIGRYLGCNHIVGEMSMADADDIVGRALPGITDTIKKWQNLTCKVKTMQHAIRYVRFHGAMRRILLHPRWETGDVLV